MEISSEDKLLTVLRKKLNATDRAILSLLVERSVITLKLGEIKIQHSIPVYQQEQWLKSLELRMKEAKETGLDIGFVKQIFTILHEQSIKEQTALKNDK